MPVGSGGNVSYRVDLGQIDQIVPRLEGLVGFVAQCLDQIDAKIRALHAAGWEGQTADAYQAAHTRWMAGARDMRDGLDAMRRNAQQAHDAYRAALAANAQTLGRDPFLVRDKFIEGGKTIIKMVEM